MLSLVYMKERKITYYKNTHIFPLYVCAGLVWFGFVLGQHDTRLEHLGRGTSTEKQLSLLVGKSLGAFS